MASPQANRRQFQVSQNNHPQSSGRTPQLRPPSNNSVPDRENVSQPSTSRLSPNEINHTTLSTYTPSGETLLATALITLYTADKELIQVKAILDCCSQPPSLLNLWSKS